MDKPQETFFTQLRRLAVSVERQCDSYRQAVSKKESEFCAPQAIKKIVDLINDIKQLKHSAQPELDQTRRDVQTLAEMTSAGSAFLNNQMESLQKQEQFLAQYGYRTYDEVYSRQKNQQDSEDENTESQERDADPRSATPPNTKPATDLNRTPRLEEAGISKNTLEYLSSLQKNKRQPEKMAVAKPRPTIPSVFEHSGIICTPSLTKSLNPNMIYNPDLHAALASPVAFSTKKDDNLPGPLEQLKLNKKPCDSPAEPVFCTPGIKQILTGSKPNSEFSNQTNLSKSHVIVGLFQSDVTNGQTSVGRQPDTKSFTEEPRVPQLSSNSYSNEEPPEPELTYSLEALTEMTGVYMINSVTKHPTAAKAVLPDHVSEDSKKNATPPEPEMLADRISRIKMNQETASKLAMKHSTAVNPGIPDHVTKDNKENATPPEPEMLADRINRTKMNQEADVQQRGFGDMPPSPKFLGQYEFLK